MFLKNRIFFALISLLIFGVFIFISGCGNPTGGGSGGSSGSNPNVGTVSGTVYIYDNSTATYIPTQDAYVSVTAEAMSAEVTVKVDSQGKYTFTGLPHGEVTLSLTKEGYTHTQTLVCNNSTVNFAQGGSALRRQEPAL